MKLHFGSVLISGLLMGSAASADMPRDSSGLPTPRGLVQCPSNDPVATLEARLAAKLGGEYLGCFRSEGAMIPKGAIIAAPTPVEYAFGLAFADRHYKLADLDNLLATVKQQWKDFDPLSKEFKESYIARLNALIKSSGSSADVVSVKPILVSIDRGARDYYAVTSIRTYVADVNGRRVTSTKVNSDAVALRGSELVRLTIQRTLSAPADVAEIQGEIADWARATTGNVMPTAQ
jgi:hypothetical protein